MKYKVGTGITVSLLLMGMAFGVVFLAPQAAAASTPVSLGAASTFAVLANTGITNTGATTIAGDVGTNTASETGFETVVQSSGTNYGVGSPTVTTAETNLSGAIVQANGYSAASILTALDSQTLVAGVYTAASTTFTLSGGVLTLNGQGDSSSVWIFQAPSTATSLVTTGGTVVLENGADSCNVFWVLGGTATIGTYTTFVGTMMAGASVTLGTGTTLQGAALASTGDVTMQTNDISGACVIAPITTNSTTPTTSTTSTTSTISTTSASTVATPSCSSGVYSGEYTNSTTQQIVYFTDLPWSIAYPLVANNGPSGIYEDCSTQSTTTMTTTAPPSCVYLTVVLETANGTALSSESSDIWNAQSQTQSIGSCVPINTAETVGVFDSGHFMFSHWLDTGSAQRFRSFSIASNATFTAVYTDTRLAIPPADSVISVSTVSSSNAQIAGLYTTLWQNGLLVQSCFTSCSFTVSNGQTYQVAVADWGSYLFNHWANGSADRFLTVAVGSTASTISEVATYGMTSGAPQLPRITQALAIQSPPATIHPENYGLALTVVAVLAMIGVLASLASFGSILRRSALQTPLTE